MKEGNCPRVSVVISLGFFAFYMSSIWQEGLGLHMKMKVEVERSTCLALLNSIPFPKCFLISKNRLLPHMTFLLYASAPEQEADQRGGG